MAKGSESRFIFGIEYKEKPSSKVFRKTSLTMVGGDTKEMNDAINKNANLLKKQEGWHEVKITKTPIMAKGGKTNSSLYKIKFDGALGEGLYYVTEAKSAEEAKNNFHSDMMGTDKPKSEPKKTTKDFVSGVKKTDGNYWVITGDATVSDKPLSYYKYDTAKITVSWKGKVQPIGIFHSAEEALEKIKSQLYLGTKLSDYTINTPDKTITLSDTYSNGGGIGSIKVGDFIKKKGSNIELKVLEISTNKNDGKDYITIYNDVLDNTQKVNNTSDYELVIFEKGGSLKNGVFGSEFINIFGV